MEKIIINNGWSTTQETVHLKIDVYKKITDTTHTTELKLVQDIQHKICYPLCLLSSLTSIVRGLGSPKCFTLEPPQSCSQPPLQKHRKFVRLTKDKLWKMHVL